MDGSLEMPNEQILEVLDRLAKRLGLAQKWEVLPTEKICSMDSFQGRLRNKGTNRFNFCKSKSPCTDCSCAPPKQAKGHTEKQPEVSPLLKKSKDRKAEIYGGFEKGKMSKKKLEKLILLNVTPGFALIDTGAQHGVIGKQNFQNLCDRLAKQNLRPRLVESSITGATGIGGDTNFLGTYTGIGGDTNFLGTYEIPVGVAGCSGVLTLSVTEKNLPPLLPVGFTKRLGMVLDQSENLATWKA